MKRLLVAAAAVIGSSSAQAQTEVQPVETMIAGDTIELAALPGAPAGVVSAVLVGTLDRPGVYVLRNKWPANTTLRPHTHGGKWRIYTVLEGEVRWGFGSRVDASQTVRLGAGSVATGPGDRPHYFTTGPDGATLQIVAEGPFTTEFIGQAPLAPIGPVPSIPDIMWMAAFDPKRALAQLQADRPQPGTPAPAATPRPLGPWSRCRGASPGRARDR